MKHKKNLLTIFITLVSILSASSVVAQNSITLMTSKKKGETIKLIAKPVENLTIEGAQKTATENEYTITDIDGEITLKGDITFLDCIGQQITTLNLSQNKVLNELRCDQNQIEILSLKETPSVNILSCSKNNLRILELSEGSQLKELYCDHNQFKKRTMDVLVASLPDRSTKNPKGFFAVFDNENNDETNICNKEQVAIALKRGWMVKEKKGSWVDYQGSERVIGNGQISLTTAKVEGEFIDLIIETNEDFSVEGAVFVGENSYKVTASDGKISIKGDVINMDCSDAKLTSLNVSRCPTLQKLSCNGNKLTALELLNNTELVELYCYDNKLNSLDISNNAKLTKFWCQNNELTSLDLSKNIRLEEFYCEHNQLNSLNVSNNTELIKLWCYLNPINTLDVSKNTKLTVLQCYRNELSELNISNNKKLKILWCDDNNITTLDTSNNPELLMLSCSSNKIASLDFSNNKKIDELHCDGNQIKGENMDLLISSLPIRSESDGEGLFGVIDNSAGSATNVCTKKQVAAAKSRGWIAKEWSATDENWIDYEGSEDTSINDILAEEEASIVAIYTVDGRRISQLQEGVNIIRLSNGKAHKVFHEVR